MKNKITTILVILLLIVLNIISSGVSSKRINYTNELLKKYFDNIESNDNETNIIILGHISPFNITEVTLINGTSSEIKKIEMILNNKILQLILPPFYIECSNLDFSISHNMNIPFFIPYIRRISYFTSLYEGLDFIFNKNTIFGRKHTVIVKGFEGYFCFQRFRPLQVAPFLFIFVGSYEEVTIIR